MASSSRGLFYTSEHLIPWYVTYVALTAHETLTIFMLSLFSCLAKTELYRGLSHTVVPCCYLLAMC